MTSTSRSGLRISRPRRSRRILRRCHSAATRAVDVRWVNTDISGGNYTSGTATSHSIVSDNGAFHHVGHARRQRDLLTRAQRGQQLPVLLRDPSEHGRDHHRQSVSRATACRMTRTMVFRIGAHGDEGLVHPHTYMLRCVPGAICARAPTSPASRARSASPRADTTRSGRKPGAAPESRQRNGPQAACLGGTPGLSTNSGRMPAPSRRCTAVFGANPTSVKRRRRSTWPPCCGYSD